MKKLLFIIFVFALIGCKTKQTMEQEKVQTTSSIQKMTVTDDSSIITIVYDMLDRFDATDSTAVSIYDKTPKKVAKHVNNCTLLPWAIIAILILILVICVKYRVWQQKISNKIRHCTEKNRIFAPSTEDRSNAEERL